MWVGWITTQNSSVGRAVDCRIIIVIHRSLVRFRFLRHPFVECTQIRFGYYYTEATNCVLWFLMPSTINIDYAMLMMLLCNNVIHKNMRGYKSISGHK